MLGATSAVAINSIISQQFFGIKPLIQSRSFTCQLQLETLQNTLEELVI